MVRQNVRHGRALLRRMNQVPNREPRMTYPTQPLSGSARPEAARCASNFSTSLALLGVARATIRLRRSSLSRFPRLLGHSREAGGEISAHDRPRASRSGSTAIASKGREPRGNDFRKTAPNRQPACWDRLNSILRLDTASLRLNSEPTRPRIGADQLAAAGDHVGPVHLPDRTLTARVLP